MGILFQQVKTSLEVEPQHIYAQPGETYTVTVYVTCQRPQYYLGGNNDYLRVEIVDNYTGETVAVSRLICIMNNFECGTDTQRRTKLKFTFRAPTRPATYSYTVRLVHTGIGLFGWWSQTITSKKYYVTVQAVTPPATQPPTTGPPPAKHGTARKIVPRLAIIAIAGTLIMTTLLLCRH